MGEKSGPEEVLRYAEVLSNANNPPLMGILFEAYFFKCLERDGVRLVDVNDNRTDLASSKEISIFDPKNPPRELVENGGWFRPKDFNQGGYDAVFIDKEAHLIRFYQMANGPQHDLKLEYFLILVRAIGRIFEVKTVEIVFVVSKKHLQEFEISTVEGEGLLASAGLGDWSKCHEREKCKIMALDAPWTF
jgi:hypothetical protein